MMAPVSETLKDALKSAFPSYGPGWAAAIDFGIDVSLLDENLRLTPTERLLQLQRMTEFFEATRSARKASDAEPR